MEFRQSEQINDYVAKVFNEFINEKYHMDENGMIFAEHVKNISNINSDIMKKVIANIRVLCKIIRENNDDFTNYYANVILNIFSNECIQYLGHVLCLTNISANNFNYGDILIFENTLDEIIYYLNDVIDKINSLEISDKRFDETMINITQDMLIIKKNLYGIHKVICSWKLFNKYGNINDILIIINNCDQIITSVINQYCELNTKKINEEKIIDIICNKMNNYIKQI